MLANSGHCCWDKVTHGLGSRTDSKREDSRNLKLTDDTASKVGTSGWRPPPVPRRGGSCGAVPVGDAATASDASQGEQVLPEP